MTEVKFGREYYHLLADMERWCTQHIGKGMWGDLNRMPECVWSISSVLGGSKFYFRDPKNATMFTLKWS
jgi:hypothetical protein